MSLRGGACLLFLAVPALSWAQVTAGPEFLVNSFTTSNQTYSAVASARNGDFVMVWSSAGQDGGGSPVFAQRYDAAGAPRGSEFRVDQGAASVTSFPDVASDAAGAFVAVWRGPDDGNFAGIFGRRFDAGGAPRGAEFVVNVHTTSGQNQPA